MFFLAYRWMKEKALYKVRVDKNTENAYFISNSLILIKAMSEESTS